MLPDDFLQSQWRAFTLNVGVWRGVLTRYNLLPSSLSQTTTQLRIYVDTLDDQDALIRNQTPSMLKLQLTYPDLLRSPSNQLYLRGQNICSRGMVFDPCYGHFCSGPVYLQTPSAAVFEQALNDGMEKEDIKERRRFVFAYTAELPNAVSVFREVAHIDDDDDDDGKACGDGDWISVRDLCGVWTVSCTVVGVDGKVREEMKKVERRMQGEQMIVVREDGSMVKGSVQEGGQCVMFEEEEGRLVFLQGGVFAKVCWKEPGAQGAFRVMGGWRVADGLIVAVERIYNDARWMYSVFRREVRVA